MLTQKMLYSKQKRRDHMRIIADILDITQEGVLKTQIMYRASLSFTQLNAYVTYLIEHNLIIQSSQDGKDIYLITAKGRAFLRCHRKLILLLKNSSKTKKVASPLETSILAACERQRQLA